MDLHIQVRHVTRSDRSEWLRMRIAFWPDCSVPQHEVEIDQFFQAPGQNAVLVAIANDSPNLCGFAELSLRHDYVESTNQSPVAYLEGWYVEPAFRGQGVGRQLIAATEQWAIAQGITELASDTEVSNRASISAHRACGFTDAVTIVHFVKRL